VSRELKQAEVALDKLKGLYKKGACVYAEDVIDILDPLIEAMKSLEQQRP